MTLPVPPTRSWILLLAAWSFVALLTKTVPESAHELSRLGTVEGLVERWTYQLDESIFLGTRDKIYYGRPFLLAPAAPAGDARIAGLLGPPSAGHPFNNRRASSPCSSSRC